jgi:single-stranded-DNA-specific exonuclease
MSIGFGIGPRINAAGRLEDAMQAYKLLSAPNDDEARQWAEKLNALNVKRQDITRAAQDKIREKLEKTTGLPLIFTGDSSFEPGIVGLVAGKLVEEYYLPTVVMEEGETESRASCRSIPQFDITHALDQCADLLVRHGGHTLAAGFTVLNENVPALKDRLMGIAQDALRGQTLSPTLDIDMRLDVHQLHEGLVQEFDMLEPTGHGNPRPVFMVEKARILEARTVGKDERHLKLKIARAGQPPLDAIGFGLGEWARYEGDALDLACGLEMNEWNGKQSLQLKLQDVRRPGA